VPFFFEGAPHGEAPSPAYVSDFLATAYGLALIVAFTRIKESTLRRRLLELVEYIAGDDLSALPLDRILLATISIGTMTAHSLDERVSALTTASNKVRRLPPNSAPRRSARATG
jgi:hypothetical protein